MMMVRKSKGLGERHQKILDFLKNYQNNNNYPPTIREIGENTGITSTSVVNYYLNQLEKKGLIEREKKISRGVRLTAENTPTSEMFRIPVLGRIVAGEPILVPSSDFAYYDAESSVEVAQSLLSARDNINKLFALEVQGNSMIDAMINEGDIVIMNPNFEARNGDMVAIWLPDRDETTLKYYYKETNRYRLQPANPTMDPIYIDKNEKLEIRGKVVMVIRKIAASQ